MTNEQSLLIEFLGNTPMVRVLDCLLTERDLDFSLSDLARNAGIGRTTLYRIWSGLMAREILIKTRVIGRATLYRFNKENVFVQKFMELDESLVRADLERRAKEQVAPMQA